MTDEPTLLTADISKPTNGEPAVLHLSGEVDMSTAGILREAFVTIVKCDLGGLIIDATDVTFIDSAGLHALVEGKQMMYESGCRIVLVPSRQVRRLLEMVFPEPLFAARVESMDEAWTAMAEMSMDEAV